MPRFADDPTRPPPAVPRDASFALRYGDRHVELPLDEFAERERVEQRSDFHCVTTWSVRDLRWGGVRATELLRRVDPDGRAGFALAKGADGAAARFVIDDLLADDVLLATHLDGEPLDLRHGAPLRLVTPAQYGYKNVKHLDEIELFDDLPDGVYGPKEHLRGRVALEERHQRFPNWMVRCPYRVAIPVTIRVAERTLARRPDGVPAERLRTQAGR